MSRVHSPADAKIEIEALRQERRILEDLIAAIKQTKK
jgi:hypothetical protein